MIFATFKRDVIYGQQGVNSIEVYISVQCSFMNNLFYSKTLIRKSKIILLERMLQNRYRRPRVSHRCFIEWSIQTRYFAKFCSTEKSQIAKIILSY